MDPLSISAASVSLIAVISKATLRIGIFIIDVRESRKDLDAISRELSSLSLCLSALADDSEKGGVGFPLSLTENVLRVIRNCDEVVQELEKLLFKLSSGSLKRKVQWVVYGRDDALKLRLNLEAHKSALDIALDMVTL